MAIAKQKNKERKTLTSYKALFLRKSSYLAFRGTILRKTARILKDLISIDMAQGKMQSSSKIAQITKIKLLKLKYKRKRYRNNHYRVIKIN